MIEKGGKKVFLLLCGLGASCGFLEPESESRGGPHLTVLLGNSGEQGGALPRHLPGF